MIKYIIFVLLIILFIGSLYWEVKMEKSKHLYKSFANAIKPECLVNLTEQFQPINALKTRELNTIDKIILHHTACNPQEANIWEIHRYHQEQGYGAVSYHFIITKYAIIQCRELNEIAYHTINQNDKSISIAIHLDLNTQYMDNQMLSMLEELIQWLKFEIPSIKEVKKHSDFNQTDCPGKHLPKNYLP